MGINPPSFDVNAYLLLAGNDKSCIVTGEAAGLRAQLDVCARKRFGHCVDFLDGIVDAASKDRFTQRHHAIHLVSMARSGNPLVLARCNVPTCDNAIMGTGKHRVPILTHRQYSDGLVMTLRSFIKKSI